MHTPQTIHAIAKICKQLGLGLHSATLNLYMDHIIVNHKQIWP